MKMKPLKIISGGQTGVDRAALDAALALGATCGGWCPSGRTAEDGTIPAHYPMTELKTGDYMHRTIQNVIDSDGTLIFYFNDLEGGTEQTVYHCIKLGKPYKLIDGAEIPISRAVEIAVLFVRSRFLRSLNVAGPRASMCPRAYPYAFQVVTCLLRQLEEEPKRHDAENV
jgi:hypothetical protein